jgi:rare lipoprotein A (peptidoglycan hydrolase)
MRTKLFVIMQSLFFGAGLLVLVPSVNPTVTEKSNARPALAPSIVPSKLSASTRKPLAVWECTSSWYGDDFDGQPTANGETYDMYASTAAHPTLPLGSIVRVVNPRNHRSEIVRINDRGPYVEGRELDVSYEVARRLGFDQHGLAKVRLELLEVPPRPRAAERAD